MLPFRPTSWKLSYAPKIPDVNNTLTRDASLSVIRVHQHTIMTFPARGPGTKVSPMRSSGKRSLMISYRFSRPELIISTARPWVFGFTKEVFTANSFLKAPKG